MPNKKTTSRVSKSGLNKKKGFQFKWWMAVVLVAVVAVIGLVILRFSNAGSWTDWLNGGSKAKLQSAFNECDTTQRNQGNNPNWGSNYTMGPYTPSNNPFNNYDKIHKACTKYLQTFYNEVGGANLTVDGDYGFLTAAATKLYSGRINVFYDQKHGLSGYNKIFSDLDLQKVNASDGVVRPEMWNWINRITYLNLL